MSQNDSDGDEERGGGDEQEHECGSPVPEVDDEVSRRDEAARGPAGVVGESERKEDADAESFKPRHDRPLGV